MPEPVTKLSLLKAAVAANDWPRALSIAAKFPNLGQHKADITRAYRVNLDALSLVQVGRKAGYSCYGGAQRWQLATS